MSDFRLNITGYSTAKFATWFYIDELSLLLDAGDGLVAALCAKAGKVKHVAISHPDRDHLSGLLQFLQINSRGESPKIAYPAGSGSFPALEAFSLKFDPDQAGRPTWSPLHSGEEWPLSAGCVLRTKANRHLPHEPGEGKDKSDKSLSYFVVRKSLRLKEPYRELSGPEIGELVKLHGKLAISDEVEETLLVYSGDTPIEPPSFWGKTRILIHEATFLHHQTAEARGQEARHSVLSDVLEMAAIVQPEKLILTHFSVRYSHEQIREAIYQESAARALSFPVYAVLPGELVRDILSQQPIWEPTMPPE